IHFSSAAATLGSPGQANYAATNAYLDALTHHHPHTTTIAWGPWTTGMAQHLDTRPGVRPLRPEEGLRLFDAALRADDSHLVAMHLDARAVAAALGSTPPLLRALVPAPPRRAAGVDGVLERLRPMAAVERDAALLELVRGEVAAVLGHTDPREVDPHSALRDLGFDSLTSVEFRNRLSALLGRQLPATLAFDHPNAAAVADHLRTELFGVTAHEPAPVIAAAAQDDPIVVVGIGCRYPGGIGTPEQMWQLLVSGDDAITAFPTDRGWDLPRIYDPATPPASMAREGGFLHDAAEFDAALFGISPREALAMDPQQRLLLETAWETFEYAGIDPTSVRGSRTGVFTGIMYNDYAGRFTHAPEEVAGHLGNGSAPSIASGRVAYVYGLEGPAITIDTACSSSLVAVHLAANALRTGECTMALAGGATVMSTPQTFTEFGRQGGLSADGRCKAFSGDADGTGWGEGAGLLLLERLSDAQHHNHPILAIIRGSAVNQDGASNGLTAPNGPAQQRVIRQALANAGLQPADIDAVEAHGTGTRLGDPVEAQALLATYGQHRNEPLWLGSIKSNIGHTQAAAGTAGIIKMIMAIHHGLLPRTLHVDAPTPEVDWTTGKVQLLTQNTPWPDNDHPRRTAVSSFGISGTNAHIILEQPPTTAPPRDQHLAAPWIISGHTPTALRAQAARLARHLEQDPASALNIGYTLATGRAMLDHRAVIVATGEPAQRSQALLALARGGTHQDMITGRASGNGVAMVFSGQGSQHPGMGHQLYNTYPAYTQAFDTACTALNPHLPQPLQNIVFGDETDLLEQTRYTQPALFALQLALYRLWESWGITPTIVAGHSVGEIAAAHIAGVLDLADAATLVTARGRLMQSLPTGGAMVAIDIAEHEIRPLLEGFEDTVDIAAVNGPSSLVLSGDRTTLTQITHTLTGHRTSWLHVSHAFHSPRIDPILAQYRNTIATLTFSAPALPFVSTVTGAPADHTTLADPDYWIRHARNTVRFADAVTHLTRHNPSYLEVGPGATLLPHLPAGAVAGLRRDRQELQALTDALAHLVAHGANPNWHSYFDGTEARPVPLPAYAFDRKRYWLDHRVGRPADLRAAGVDGTDHAVLTAVVTEPESDTLTFCGRIALDSHPWLADHRVGDRVVLPGAAYVDLILHAGAASGRPGIDDLTLEAPLVLAPDSGVDLRLTVGPPDTQGRRPVRVHTREPGAEQTWTRHATALLADSNSVPQYRNSQAWPPRDARPLDLDSIYDELASRGLRYGTAFRGLRAAWSRPGEVFAEVALPESVGVTGHVVHPALLDAALHAIGIGGLVDTADPAPRLPFAWRDVRIADTGATALRVRLAGAGQDTVTLELFDTDGHGVGGVAALSLRPAPAPARSAAPRSLLGIRWQELPASHGPAASWWVVLGDDEPGLASILQDTGIQVEKYADLADLGAAAESSRTAPEAVFLAPTTPDGVDVPAATAQLTSRVLAFLQTWLADRRFSSTRLVLMTRDAATDPVMATLTGLVRVAQAEHPDRITLIDIDSGAVDFGSDALITAVATGEPHTRIRDGAALAPRFAALAASDSVAVDLSAGTVLVTGASGALGGLIARRLVATHGVRNLLLVSRTGGMTTLRTALENAGTSVEVVACDLAERDQVAALLAHRPVHAVVHAAGVLEDGVVESLTAEQLARVLRPKVDAAWHLHELTSDLTAFVLFSSIAGTLGSAGQAAYAAANTFLDALATHRAARGLPATALAWGPWATENGMTAGRRRLERAGLTPLRPEEGLALFDAALTRPEPVLIPARTDLTALRTAAKQRSLQPIWHALVPPPSTHARRAEPDRAARLADLSGDARDRALLDLVRREVAAALGHDSPDEFAAERAFTELGFDSLTAVDLRNRLEQATGLRLPASLVFEQPTPPALVRYLSTELGSAAPSPTSSDDTLGAMFRQACEQARIDEGMELVRMASRFRPVFRTPEELGRPPAPVPLARGSGEPRLFCFPAVVAMSGAHQYARFAAALRDRRDTVVLPEPGFLAGERLPAHVTALAELQARAVRELAAGTPYALLGYSSGGWIAHEVAARLERTDTPPSAVIFLDTYLPREMTPRLSRAFTHGLFTRRSDLVSSDHVSLTAMGGYFSVFGAWEPRPLGVPTLFVRAADALPDLDGTPLPDTDWGPAWARCDTDIDVPGDHFTIVAEHAEDTARAVDSWLTALR
ncbi:SDR family NAD(P)-dependent oxidoreductase, partial [Nocardia sp. NEAU-G5]